MLEFQMHRPLLLFRWNRRSSMSMSRGLSNFSERRFNTSESKKADRSSASHLWQLFLAPPETLHMPPLKHLSQRICRGIEIAVIRQVTTSPSVISKPDLSKIGRASCRER